MSILLHAGKLLGGIRAIFSLIDMGIFVMTAVPGLLLKLI